MQVAGLYFSGGISSVSSVRFKNDVFNTLNFLCAIVADVLTYIKRIQMNQSQITIIVYFLSKHIKTKGDVPYYVYNLDV